LVSYFTSKYLVNDETMIQNLVKNSRDFIKECYNILIKNPELIIREALEN